MTGQRFLKFGRWTTNPQNLATEWVIDKVSWNYMDQNSQNMTTAAYRQQVYQTSIVT